MRNSPALLSHAKLDFSTMASMDDHLAVAVFGTRASDKAS